MKQVMNTQTARLDVSTYRAIQSIKYPLRAAGKTAVQYFKKEDFLHSFLDACVVQNLNASAREYVIKQKETQQVPRARKEALSVDKEKVQSKSAEIERAKLAPKKTLRAYRL